MYAILLSGGSGKRLWPLSSALRPKQYIRLLKDEETGEPCSMVQRVWKQLQKAGLAQNSILCADWDQVELIYSQLGRVGIAVEPESRDTFPAVALSCSYLKSKLNACEDDIVCILPVDPYTDQSYFEALKCLPEALNAGGAQIALMGVRPTAPSAKYGYILPGRKEKGYVRVASFREKPDEAEARRLIARGALWNCGVFCLRIGDILEKLAALGLPPDYEALCRQYRSLPEISFDYEVLEKSKKLVAVPFEGMWEDLGTWNAVSEIMEENMVGECRADASCRNLHVINETGLPLVAAGLRDLIIVACYDGILVADKKRCADIKSLIGGLPFCPGYEERRWGTITVLDFSQAKNSCSLTRKVHVRAGLEFSAQCKESYKETWTVIEGAGELTFGRGKKSLRFGDSVQIPSGMRYSLRACGDLWIMQVLTGANADAPPKNGADETK